jgi:predicted RNA-binding Zn-ribbon protein involved in translation (DUF1610 family)
VASFPKLKVDPIHPRHDAEAHECPACGRNTKRRIRVLPTFGIEDARCDRCVKTNKWPEQGEGVKHGNQEEQAASPVEGQASFI